MVELSAGKHMINVGISYDEMPESSRVYNADTWAWKSDKAIEIGENDLLISIKRKWHLFKPVTAEAEIMKIYSKEIMMSKLSFDKKTFNWGYAFVYTILQCIFVVGFVAAVCMVVLSSTMGATFTIPDLLLPVVVAYLFVSLVVFPLVSIIKKGYECLVKGSSVSCDGGTIIYDKLVDRLWTAVGHVEEHHIYTISKIESVTTTKFAYIIKGSIEKVVINNGRKLESKSVSVVKIPNAYANLEKIIK